MGRAPVPVRYDVVQREELVSARPVPPEATLILADHFGGERRQATVQDGGEEHVGGRQWRDAPVVTALRRVRSADVKRGMSVVSYHAAG